MFKLGPLRLNLSKAGVGLSVGVTGGRVGIRGSDGRLYLHAGREGLYYRKTLAPDDPSSADAVEKIATRIEKLLDETASRWIPALQTMAGDGASDSEKQAASAEFEAVTNEIVETLKSDGLPLEIDGDLTKAVSLMHADLVLAGAFPQHYSEWSTALDDQLDKAQQVVIGALGPELLSKAADSLRDGRPLPEVVADLQRGILPELQRRNLLIEDNPVYSMRIGGLVSDTVIDGLLRFTTG